MLIVDTRKMEKAFIILPVVFFSLIVLIVVLNIIFGRRRVGFSGNIHGDGGVGIHGGGGEGIGGYEGGGGFDIETGGVGGDLVGGGGGDFGGGGGGGFSGGGGGC